ncbi:MAG: hypothetical protein LUE99_10305 [Bacteroides sp.]|nr:hypothetical protein [Bacteroides sp.]
MADNYLEKQRESYEARKAAWERERKFGKKKKKKVMTEKAKEGKAEVSKFSSSKEEENLDTSAYLFRYFYLLLFFCLKII